MLAVTTIECAQVLPILYEIKTAVENMRGSTLMIALVGMTGVVVGSVVSGAFQLWVRRATAKSEQIKLLTQLKADVISKQRQQWMDSIREAAKDLIAEYDLVYNFLQSKQASQERIDEGALRFSLVAGSIDRPSLA